MNSKVSLEFLQELMNEEDPDVTLEAFQVEYKSNFAGMEEIIICCEKWSMIS